MPRGKHCREAIFACPFNLERGTKPSLVRERQFGRHLNSHLGEGNCDLKVATRQWRADFRSEAFRCLAGPFGQVRRSGAFLLCPVSKVAAERKNSRLEELCGGATRSS